MTIRAGEWVRVNGRPAGCPTRYTRTAMVLFVDQDLGLAKVRFKCGNRWKYGEHLVQLSLLKPTKK